jgi:L-ascorbate metabolism protein UlaG (beta-lactamase superfamily)
VHDQFFNTVGHDMAKIANAVVKVLQNAPRRSAPVVKSAWSPLSISARDRTADSPLTITRITHACVLIEWGDGALLTDPWFSEKPLYHHGESLPFDVSGLPDLTAVLSSMNHYDHFDVNAFSAYRNPAVPFVTIKGSGQGGAARKAGFVDVRDVAAGASIKIGGATLHAIAANGFAPDTFRYEQCYVIEVAGRTILFCPHFLKDGPLARVKAQFPNIDLALLGINGLRIKPLLGRQMSMDPADAARVCAGLNIPVCVPIHYAFNGGWFSSTFLLSHKGTPSQFAEAARRRSPLTNVVTLSPGQPLAMI